MLDVNGASSSSPAIASSERRGTLPLLRMPITGWLSGAGFNRWLVPPAALCVHLCIGMASPMLQEMFGGRLLGLDTPFETLGATDLDRVAAVGAGFTGLLSLFNILGRFFWSWQSDAIGRKTTYGIFFLLGIALDAAVPAYLADLFGTGFVGAIHGRLLTAWSVAGILGPVLVNDVNQQQINSGVPRAAAYDRTMLLLAGFWLVVAVPMAWGLWATMRQAAVLFG